MLEAVPGDSYYSNLITGVLLGVIDAEEISDTRTIRRASKSLFHAAAVASKLASKSNKHVIITLMDNLYSGVVMIVNPPALVTDPANAIILCRVELGMVRTCSTIETSKLWALNGGFATKIYLVPPYLGGRQVN